MLSLASSVPSLAWPEILLRLSVAAGLGALVGVEREYREREAGIRTHLLVSLGAALFTIVGAYGFHDFATTVDPTRIAAQIVTGIGFLGAGAIVREGVSVRGLTTAGSLWVVAAIGLAAGVGFWTAAVVTTLVVIFALGPLRWLAYRTLAPVRPENRLVVELRAGQPIEPFLAELADVRHFELTEHRDRRVIELDLPRVDERIVARLCDLDYVIGVRWRR